MTPTLYFVIGPAGSGKSTISKVLAQHLHATYLDKDTLATRFTETLLSLAGTNPHDRDNNEYYQRVVMELEYQTLLALAGDNLRLGNSVVLDAPFGRYFRDDDYLIDEGAEHDWPNETRKLVIHLTVPGQTLKDRVAVRGNSRDAWKLDHWDEFWASAQAAECAWKGAHHVLFDNSSAGMQPEVLDTILRDFV